MTNLLESLLSSKGTEGGEKVIFETEPEEVELNFEWRLPYLARSYKYTKAASYFFLLLLVIGFGSYDLYHSIELELYSSFTLVLIVVLHQLWELLRSGKRCWSAIFGQDNFDPEVGGIAREFLIALLSVADGGFYK